MYRKLFRNCSTLSAGLVIGRLSGMLKVAVTAAIFGTSDAMDAYLVAMTVPAALLVVFGDAVYVATVKLVSRHKHDAAPGGWHEVSSLFNFSTAAMLALGALYWWFAPVIVRLIAPGFSPAKYACAVTLARCVAPVIILIPVQNVLIAFLNVHDHFAVPALKFFLPNVLAVASIVLFSKHLGIASYALGSVAGEAVVCVLCYVLAKSKGACYFFTWAGGSRGMRESLSLGVPILLCIGVLQVNNLTDRMFASGLPEGSISALGYAMLLLTFPLSIVRTVVDAGFPSITAIVHRPSENDGGQLVRAVRACVKLLAIVAVPSAVMLLLWRTPVIAILLQRGRFDAASAAATGAALFFYAFALVPMAARHFLMRLSQSFGDSLTPLPSNIVCACANIAFNFLLVPMLGHVGIALSLTLATTLGAGILYAQLRRRIPALHSCGIETEAIRVLGAAGIMVAAYATVHRLTGWFIPAGFGAGAAYAGALVLCGAVPLGRIRQWHAAFRAPGRLVRVWGAADK